MKALDTQVGGSHYKSMKIQPMEYSMANGLNACQHTIIKYVTRYPDKGGIEDLRKAIHTIDLLIEFEMDKHETPVIDPPTHTVLQEPEWPEYRMDSIGRNGNDGEHYLALDELKLRADFEASAECEP